MSNGQFTVSVGRFETKSLWFQTTIISFVRDSGNQQFELGSARQIFCSSCRGSFIQLQSSGH